jgi:hypothetical protein
MMGIGSLLIRYLIFVCAVIVHPFGWAVKRVVAKGCASGFRARGGGRLDHEGAKMTKDAKREGREAAPKSSAQHG